MQTLGEEDDYVVVFRVVAVRDQPSTSGKNVGAVSKGKQVRGIPFLNPQKEPWLRLTNTDDEKEERWMLIDGSKTSLGVGILLEPSADSIAGHKKAVNVQQKEVSPNQSNQKPTWYEVLHKRVVVRRKASVDSTILGYYDKGDRLFGTCEAFDNWKWLRLTKENSANEQGFILIDGTTIGLGILLTEVANVNASTQKQSTWKPLVKERTLEDLSKWLFYPNGEPACNYRVVLDYVMVRKLPSAQAASAGVVRKGDVLTGEKRDEWLLLTPNVDNQSLSEGQGKWILIDGKSLGKGLLLERCLPEPAVKRCYMNAVEVKLPEKDRAQYTLEVKPEDSLLIEAPCSKGKMMLIHELSDNCKCQMRLCLKNSEEVLAASSWVEFFTLEDYNKSSEEFEPCMDLLGDLRLGCEQCSCPCYTMDTNITLNSDMTDQRCARCGCNVTAHEKVKPEGAKKKKKAEPMLVDKAIALPKDHIIRRWAKFDIPASQTHWQRLKGNFKEVVAWSDLHADMGTNMDHLSQLPECKETVLLVAGDVATSIECIEASLSLLQEKYGAVFYVPGNHDLWIAKKDGYSSLHKFMILLELCEKIGVHTQPAFISDDCAVCPMFSWYKDNLVDNFKRDMADIAFDIQTMWPWDLTGRGDTQDAQQPEIADFFAKLNTRRIAVAPKANQSPPVTIVTMSHFVPRQEVYPGPRRLCGVMGCREIESQVRECGSSCHVFGHSHISVDKRWEGVRYVQHPLGYPSDFHRKVVPLRVWGTTSSRNHVGTSSPSRAVSTHGLDIAKKIVEEVKTYKEKLLKRPPGRWSTGIDWDHANIFDKEKEMKLREALGQTHDDVVRMFYQQDGDVESEPENLEFVVRHLETLDEIEVCVASTLSIKQLKEHIVELVGRGFPSQIMLSLGGDSELGDTRILSEFEDHLEHGLSLLGISLAAPQVLIGSSSDKLTEGAPTADISHVREEEFVVESTSLVEVAVEHDRDHCVEQEPLPKVAVEHDREHCVEQESLPKVELALGHQRQDVDLVVHIDRELCLTETFKVTVGSTIGALKQTIAEADPTGMSKPSDIGLKMGERILLDAELVTHAFSELDLCEL